MFSILAIAFGALGTVMLIRLSSVSHADYPNSDPAKFALWKKKQARAYISFIVFGFGWPLTVVFGGLLTGMYLAVTGAEQQQIQTFQTVLSIIEVAGVLLLLPVPLIFAAPVHQLKHEAGVDWPKKKRTSGAELHASDPSSGPSDQQQMHQGTTQS